MAKSDPAKKIIQHPDKDEILSKLLMNFSSVDIAEWLKAKYTEPHEKHLVLSEKAITSFKNDYLDFYSIIKEDIEKTRQNQLVPEEQLKLDIQGNSQYHKALETYLDNEIDIKVIVKKLVVNAEMRISQMFDIIQADPRNFKADRTLIEWFSTLANILERYDTILNGAPNQVNIQNNINIQVVDEHIASIYNIIKDILTKLDYDTSLMFIDMWNERMKNLTPATTQSNLPVEERLVEAKLLEETVLKQTL